MKKLNQNPLAPCDAIAISEEWIAKARPDQLPPDGDWRTWLLLGGRGAGKTRAGAEWVHGLVHGYPPFCKKAVGVIALIGETLSDVREVMIEGVAGICSLSRHDRPRYEASRKRLLWDNGAVAYAFSAEDPESLRGPQFGAAWGDEAGKWRYAEATYDMLQFGLRLGTKPRSLMTTTPKPTPLIKRLLADQSVIVSRASTHDNAVNLAPNFITALEQAYGGTRLGRQELDGELIEDVEGALWRRPQLESIRREPPQHLVRICVSVDPPASSHDKSDACGIIVAALDADGFGWVLEDATVQGAQPEEWAAVAIRCFEAHRADTIIAEINQGGDMVTSVLRAVDPKVPVQTVRANRGKWLRAEPVAALYAQGRIRHVRGLAQLEDEMCAMTPNGKSGGHSPDRVDALVWALIILMLGDSAAPKIRHLA